MSKQLEKTFVGIAQMAISGKPDMTLCAPNLGSCLGITVYDPKRKEGGLIHCLLPMSKNDPAKAEKEPCMYVDTGFAKLLNHFLSNGSSKKDLIISVAGGSQINDTNGVFEIGKKNYTVLRKILWKNNLLLKAENVGGESSRTLTLSIATGDVWLKMNGETLELK